MKKRIKNINISKPAFLILLIGLPLVALSLFYILFTLNSATTNDIGWIFARSVDMLEYATVSLMLVFGGAFLADIAFKKK